MVDEKLVMDSGDFDLEEAGTDHRDPPLTSKEERAYTAARRLIKEGSYDSALEILEGILRHNPELTQVYRVKGEALRAADRLEEAIATLGELLDMVPGDIPTRKSIAEMELRRAELEEAARDSRTLPYDDLIGKAREQMDKQKHRVARKYLKRAMEQRPDGKMAKRLMDSVNDEIARRDARKRLLQADENMAAGRWKAALLDVDSVIKEYPRSSSALIKKLELLIRLDRIDEVTYLLISMPRVEGDPRFKELLAWVRNEVQVRRYRDYIEQGKSSEEAGDIDQAIFYYTSAIDLDASDMDLVLRATRHLVREMRYEEALQLLRELEEKAKDPGPVKDVKGRIEEEIDDIIRSASTPAVRKVDTGIRDGVELGALALLPLMSILLLWIASAFVPSTGPMDGNGGGRALLSALLILILLLGILVNLAWAGLMYLRRMTVFGIFGKYRVEGLARSRGSLTSDRALQQGPLIPLVVTLGFGYERMYMEGHGADIGSWIPWALLTVGCLMTMMAVVYLRLSYSKRYRETWALGGGLLLIGALGDIIALALDGSMDGMVGWMFAVPAAATTLMVMALVAFILERTSGSRFERIANAFEERFKQDNGSAPVLLRELSDLPPQQRAHPGISLMECSLKLHSRDLDDARECYLDILNQDPLNPKAWRQKGSIEKAEGVQDKNRAMMEEAGRSLADAVGLDPSDPVAWNSIGNLDFINNDLQGAIAAFDRALEIDPDYAHAHNNRGLVLIRFGKYPEALSSLDEAIRLDPRLSEAWKNKSLTLSRIGRTDEARIAMMIFEDVREGKSLAAIGTAEAVVDDGSMAVQEDLAPVVDADVKLQEGATVNRFLERMRKLRDQRDRKLPSRPSKTVWLSKAGGSDGDEVESLNGKDGASPTTNTSLGNAPSINSSSSSSRPKDRRSTPAQDRSTSTGDGSDDISTTISSQMKLLVGSTGGKSGGWKEVARRRAAGRKGTSPYDTIAGATSAGAVDGKDSDAKVGGKGTDGKVGGKGTDGKVDVGKGGRKAIKRLAIDDYNFDDAEFDPLAFDDDAEEEDLDEDLEQYDLGDIGPL